MTEKELFEIEINAPDADISGRIMKRWDSLSKPIDGLGDFERAIAKIGAIQGASRPSVSRRFAVIMCADNGIVEEGISQSSQEITRSVAVNLGNGTSSACTLAKAASTEVIPIDLGINYSGKIPGVRECKVRMGSANFLKESALNENEVLSAIETGIRTVEELKGKGADIIATGEMGIGNTTTSAVLLCGLLGLDPLTFTGRGAGLDDERLVKKKQVVCRGVDILKGLAAESDRDRALKSLTLIGGLDIAGLVGVYIGGALYHVPIVIDGMISATAAVCADMIIPGVRDFMLASHEGREKTIEKALDQLGCRALLKGNMALGEGTGAIMLFPLLDQVIYFYENASSFEDTDIEAYQRFEKCSGQEK